MNKVVPLIDIGCDEHDLYSLSTPRDQRIVPVSPLDLFLPLVATEGNGSRIRDAASVPTIFPTLARKTVIIMSGSRHIGSN